MKAINTKEMMELYTAYREAMTDVKYYERHSYDSEWAKSRLEDSKKSAESNLKAFLSSLGQLDMVLEDIQKRTTVRNIDSAHIIEWLYDYTQELNIPKKYMDGITVRVNLNAQKFPSAYKYTPESTWFMATYKSGSWRVIGIIRDTCTNCGRKVTLPEEAQKALVRKYM